MITYEGYCINGFNFATRDQDNNNIIQNNGVYVVANTLQISSSKDKNLHYRDIPFYGVVNEIWELHYCCLVLAQVLLVSMCKCTQQVIK